MARQTTLRPLDLRSLAYVAFAVLALLPVAAFVFGPLSGDSFDLQGPGGPLLAFSAGVLSFVSPCVLPLVPIYLTHLSGATVRNGTIIDNRRRTFMHAVAFVGGLAVVFIVLGSAAGLLGSYIFKDNQRSFQQIAGVLVAAMGIILIPQYGRQSPLKAALMLLALTVAFAFVASVADLRGDRVRIAELGGAFLLAWLRFSGYLRLSFMSRTFAFDTSRVSTVGYTQSAFVGGAFALGWTPCIGPILGSILTLAATSSQAFTGTYLLVAYSVGFSVPFLICALALADANRLLKRIQPYSAAIEVASGVMLIAVGMLLITGRLSSLNQYFQFADFNQGL